MKKSLLFLMALVLSVGQMWAEGLTVTAKFTVADDVTTTYNGNAQAFEVKVLNGETEYQTGDFSVSIDGGATTIDQLELTDVDEYTITVKITKADDELIDQTATASLTIEAIDLGTATITISDQDFTGANIDAISIEDITIADLGFVLQENDLTLSEFSGKDAGENAGSVTVGAGLSGNFKASKASVLFTILAADISTASFTVKAKTYTGSGITLAEEDFSEATWSDGISLVYGTDYEVLSESYSNNTAVGIETAAFTITGLNNFAGSTKTQVKFTIDKADITAATFTLTESSLPYTGAEQTPEIASISLDGISGDIDVTGFDVIVADGPAKDVKDGGYDVTITAKDDNANFTGTNETPAIFTITSIPLTAEMITLTTTYTGSEIDATKVPAIVKVGDTTLPSEGFTVSYTGDPIVQVGPYTVTVTSTNTNVTGENVEATLTVISAPSTYYTIALSIAEGIEVLDYTSGNLQIEEDGHLFLQFLPETEGGEVVLLIDGVETEYTKNETGYSTYILNPIEKNYSVELYLKAYSVTFQTVEGITFEGEETAEYGKPYTFKMILADGMNPEDINVYVNDVLVEADPLRSATYTVTIDKVTGPIVVRVENKTVGIQPITTGRVYSQYGALIVETTAAQAVQVYSLAGTQAFDRVVNGSETIALTPGVYIVRVGGEVQKVVVR